MGTGSVWRSDVWRVRFFFHVVIEMSLLPKHRISGNGACLRVLESPVSTHPAVRAGSGPALLVPL